MSGGRLSVSPAELETDVLAVLRFNGPQTAVQLADVVGVSGHTAHAVLGLLAVRRAVAVCGHVDAGTDALRRRIVHALWRVT